MNEFLVLVPTTQKLVGITDIVEENKGILPVVCVTNELKSLPISNEYKNLLIALPDIELIDIEKKDD